MYGVDATVVSTYVRLNTPWDPREPLGVRQHCASVIFLCGDFITPCESWGDSRTDAGGELIFSVVVALKLVALYVRRPTFVRPGVSGRVLDVTFASPVLRSRVLWWLKPDT